MFILSNFLYACRMKYPRIQNHLNFTASLHKARARTRDPVLSDGVHGFFILALMFAIMTMAGMTTAGAQAGHQPPVAWTTEITLPEKRPDLSAVENVLPENWTEAEIKAARKICAPVLAETNAEFKTIDPLRKGKCGTAGPVKLSALGTTVRVQISPPASLNCNMVRALYRWLEEKVQPEVKRVFGTEVVELRNVASYSCRNRYNDPKQKLSEHALANALDIAAFKLANGKRVTVLAGWGETQRDREKIIEQAEMAAKAAMLAHQEAETRRQAGATPDAKVVDGAALHQTRAARPSVVENIKAVVEIEIPKPSPLNDKARFLRKLHEGACGIFGTVLGPEANDAHRDHFHFDLASRRRSAYCE